MQNPPSFVTVRQYDIAIELVPDLENYGEFEPGVLTIRLRANQPAQLMADTLMHEILHALHFSVTHKKRLTEEKIARLYSGGLMQIFRDNAELVRWFIRAVRG